MEQFETCANSLRFKQLSMRLEGKNLREQRTYFQARISHKMQTLALEKVRKLEIARPPESQRPGFFSSASGIVVFGDQIVVVADDEHSIGIFSPESNAAGSLIHLEENELPLEKKARKKAKPDHEALFALDANRLIAMPSGSKPNRRMAHEIHLARNQVSRVDVSDLFLELEKDFSELNIEGSALVPGFVCLAQRGNSAEGRNALIFLDHAGFVDALTSSKSISAKTIRRTQAVELGTIDSIPLSITDISPTPNGNLLFTAAAEDTQNTFEDGEIRGSCVGVMNLDGKVEAMIQIAERVKLEGIAFDSKRKKIYLVTDADEPNEPSWLYALEASILLNA